MRLVESSDGTVKVVELDPTKWYWIVADHGAIDPKTLRWKNGLIVWKRAGADVSFVESGDRVVISMAGRKE